MKKDNILASQGEIDESRQGEVFAKGAQNNTKTKKYYIESYGCAMNFNDSEIIASLLGEEGYEYSTNMEDADLLFINTCSIREKAEHNVRQRLRHFAKAKMKNRDVKIGVLGCMAERLKTKFLDEEKLVDMVVGPDAYRDLPNLIRSKKGEKNVSVKLSRIETYDDIKPMRIGSNEISAFISIMRGCDNMCSFCVVPFTRGRERSRNAFSIVAEATDLVQRGYKEVTLLGQNVDSYRWENPETNKTLQFHELIEMVALVHPDLRVRFSTSHPKDITDDLLHIIAKYENVCNYIHLPVQSGNSRVLKLMNRTYDREWYENRVNAIYKIIPDCAISSDFITGFCTETEEEHQDSLSIIEFAKYTMSYMFFYSERPGTLAAKKYEDDIPLATKKRRLSDIIRVQSQVSFASNKRDIGKTFKVLIDGVSKKSDDYLKGRNSQNKVIVFKRDDKVKTGDYVYVKVNDTTSATLKGELI